MAWEGDLGEEREEQGAETKGCKRKGSGRASMIRPVECSYCYISTASSQANVITIHVLIEPANDAAPPIPVIAAKKHSDGSAIDPWPPK